MPERQKAKGRLQDFIGTPVYCMVFGILVLISILGTGVARQSNAHYPELLEFPRVQKGPVRAQDLRILEPVVTMPSAVVEEGSLPLRNKVRIEAGPKGELFVIDDGGTEDLLHEFSPDGRLIGTLDGPEVPKMTSVTDLLVLQDELWVANLLDSTIHRMDRKSQVWTTTKIEPAPYRILTSSAEELLVMRIGEPLPFHRIDRQGKVLGSFGTLLKEQDLHSLILDGFIVRSGESILWSGKDFGVLASFSEDGRLHYTAEMIAPPETPALMTKGQSRWVRHSPIQASRSIDADEDRLFVLRDGVEGLTIRAFLDLYRISDGSYLRSLRLPAEEDWRSIAVGADSLYIASSKRVAVWSTQVLREAATISGDRVGRTLIRFLPTPSETEEL